MTDDRNQLLLSCVEMATTGTTPEQMRDYLAGKIPAEEIEDSIEAIRATYLWRYTLKDGTVQFPARASH